LNEDMNERKLSPLKAVLGGIRSKETVDFVTEYVTKMFRKNLVKKLRAKDSTEEVYEVYYLILEFSDSLALLMVDEKTTTRALKLCKKGISKYAVGPSATSF